MGIMELVAMARKSPVDIGEGGGSMKMIDGNEIKSNL